MLKNRTWSKDLDICSGFTTDELHDIAQNSHSEPQASLLSYEEFGLHQKFPKSTVKKVFSSKILFARQFKSEPQYINKRWKWDCPDWRWNCVCVCVCVYLCVCGGYYIAKTLIHRVSHFFLSPKCPFWSLFFYKVVQEDF